MLILYFVHVFVFLVPFCQSIDVEGAIERFLNGVGEYYDVGHFNKELIMKVARQGEWRQSIEVLRSMKGECLCPGAECLVWRRQSPVPTL